MKKLYTANATTIAGREGHTETDDKKIVLDLAAPGSSKPGSNPEQLFACGYSACFGSAIGAVAKKENVTIEEIKVQASVDLNMDDEGGYFIAATLNVSLKGVDAETAQHLVEKAHHVCPYSKATRGNIEVTLKVNDTEISAKAA